jgi:GNAT superfamily N-acetyltransferase
MLTIRPARAQDLDALVDLLAALFSLETDFRPDARRQRRGLERMLEDPARRLVLVAERDGSVIGMITVQLVVSTAEGGDAGLVEDLIVAGPHRGAGVGRRLLASAEHWAWSRGATRLQLLADRENALALGFYAVAGWTPTRLVCRRRGGVR